MTIRPRLGMLGLATGYFLWYAPYAALTKAVSAGLLPGIEPPPSGLVLLPAAALGTLAGSALFLSATGWWRYAADRPPARVVVPAGFCMAIVIAATTLNYTFAGMSILLMLLLMRGGVLVLSPVVDALRRRPVRAWSWAALTLSLLAVTAALADVDHYTLVAGAVVSLAAYLLGYLGRFQIMSRAAKTGVESTDRGYLVGEQVAAVVWQVALCAVLAVAGVGALREGFTSFLLSPAALPAFGIGMLYAALFVYGTLIYLDPREYSWCVPANRCASVLAGVVATYALAAIAGVAVPGPGQLVATGLVGLALIALSYPALRKVAAPAVARLRDAVPRHAATVAARREIEASPRLLLFVCSGNRVRSAMAESIAGAELAGLRTTGALPHDRLVTAASAGLTARPGTPMAEQAVAALCSLGIPSRAHRSRRLVPEMCRASAAVYCMTEAQRAAVAELAPEARARTFRLDPARDIAEPASGEAGAYRSVAETIRHAVRLRLREQVLQPQAGG